jgi:large subunit ribosomal protein L24
MKNKFSTHWKASKQPRKQRKYRANAPLHIKRKLLSANLSKDLRKKFKKRNIPVVKGDTVRVMTGKFKGKTGKIIEANTSTSKIKIEGIMVKKQDGSKASIKMQPSNVQITELNLNDKKRMKMNKEDSNKKTESKENKVEEKK